MVQEGVAEVVVVAAAGYGMALLAIPARLVDSLLILVLQVVGVEEVEAEEAAVDGGEAPKSICRNSVSMIHLQPLSFNIGLESVAVASYLSS